MDKPGEDYTFFADVMLGRLARWLRILGYDTRYERGIGDDALLAGCAADGRILLTRDAALSERHAAARIIFLESEKPLRQLAQLARECAVRMRPERLFSRCTWCGGALLTAEKETARGKVPPYVFSCNERFHYCPVCDKYYWRGTHQERFIALIAGAFASKG